MMEGLLAIAQQFSSEVLALCLETLCVVLAVSLLCFYGSDADHQELK